MSIRALALVTLGLVSAANADSLKVGGVGAATNLLPVLSAKFASTTPNGALDVIPSLGSSGALKALAEGALDLAVAGRPLNAEEIRLGLRVRVAIRTPYVMVTSHDKPNGLKSSEIADIFRAPKANWADGSPLRVILRPKSDSDTPLLAVMFPEMTSAIEAARARHDVVIAATDQDNADAAERIAGSLTGSTLMQIRAERRALRVIPIDGVAPSLQALESGAYPFSKTIYFVLPRTDNPLAEEFVDFLRSPAGEAALRDGQNLLVAVPDRS